MKRAWLRRSQRRLVWAATGIALAVAVAAAVTAGIRLHHAVLLERQTLRTQGFSQAALELQATALETPGRVAPALAAADRALRLVTAHDAAEGARLRTAYTAYVDAVRRSGELQPALARLNAQVAAEEARLADATSVVNPKSRTALILAAVCAALVVLLLVWLFELERRSGRIDRDNATRAEELIRLRDEFVAVVSHELRTPLTSITGYLDLLADEGTDNLTADQASYLAVVARGAQRLHELVSDLLLVAETGRRPLSLELTDIDLAALAEHAVQAARPAAERRSITLTAEHGPAGTVHGDVGRLGQVLDNLVSNAIKFTPEGGSVTVRTAVSDGSALFEVADTGHGIGAADRARLFEPFYRTREATAQAVPGTGLGLTIAKAIVDAHRGRIEVDSEPARGTTVRVRLPARAAAPVAS